ncbi:hypothetical protein BGZ51_003014 [Haplosporangium sp. Z 767]|nr:hypothetical protein BGZ51_003014 [Haplosporangium sp. Z 767]KAF9185690.1 hypothetical protein BGZ50_002913 [Haplosporangium sp. Z 11]
MSSRSIPLSLRRPQSPKLHALDLLEIRTLIAQYLSKQDLAQCILVSKKWAFEFFLPLYWHTVDIAWHKLARCNESALRQYGHYVRILSAGRIEDTSVFNQDSIAHLQKLRVSTSGSKEREDSGRGCLQEIVNRNAESLLELYWRSYGHDARNSQRPFRLWVDMFAPLEHLETIELWNWSLTRLDFIRMLRVCPLLKRLVLEASEDIQDPLFDNSEDSNDNTASDNHKCDDSLSHFKHNGLRSLVFTGNLIPSFFQHLPSITHLSILDLLHGDFRNAQDYFQGDIQGIFVELTHLTMRTQYSASAPFMAIVSAVQTLVSFEGNVPFPVVEDFLELVLQKHSQTIEHLILRTHTNQPQQENPQEIFRFNFWRIFESCPKLITLEIPYSLKGCVGYVLLPTAILTSSITAMSASNPFSEIFEDLVLQPYEPAREWVCKDLKRLSLRLRDMDERHPMDQITLNLCVDRLLPPDEKRDNSRRTHSALERMILERLSGLKKLETLAIGGSWYNLPAQKHQRSRSSR